MLLDDARTEVQASAEQTVRPVGFGPHVIYCGEKYEEMVRWYQTFFQGEVRTVSDTLPADIASDDTTDSIILVKRPDLPVLEGRQVGIFHVAWSYPSLAELMYVYRKARDNGILPVEVLNSGILLQVYYKDPEGNGVEIEVDDYDTSEETYAVQRAMSFVRSGDPKHWHIDPEKVIAMLEAGVPDKDILHHVKYGRMVASGQF